MIISAATTATPNIIAISGGKGGVGKTSIAVNLSIALARLNNRVCLFDGDAGLANVNILLGIEPKFTLEHLISGEQPITEIMLKGPEGLTVIPGASGVTRCADLNQTDQLSLIKGLEQIESAFDWMVADTAAGISATTIRMIESAQLTAIVITPEPTSLTDAFSLLKVLHRNGYQRRVLVIVNMASSGDQPQSIFRRFQSAVHKYIGLETQYLGCVWMDESMRVAVSNQKPVATLPESDPSCRRFMRLADNLISFYREMPVERQTMSQYWSSLIAKHEKEPASTTASIPRATSETPLHDEPSIDQLIKFIEASPDLDSDTAITLTTTLLKRVNPKSVTKAQYNNLKQQIHSAFPIAVESALSTDDFPAAVEVSESPSVTLNTAEAHLTTIEPLSITAEPLLTTAEPLSPASDPLSKPSIQSRGACPHSSYYDNTRFGPQDLLVNKIRNLSNDISLDEFLAQR